MTSPLIRLVSAILLIYLSMFLCSEQVQAENIKIFSIGFAQQAEVHIEPKISLANKSESGHFINFEENQIQNMSFPTIEAYDPTIIADGFSTGKKVGYKLGRAIKSYACSNSELDYFSRYLNCLVER